MARRGYVQLVFQSTLPLRGATAYRFSIDETLIISIHTPLAGSDVCGRISVDGEFISIHTPLAGSDVAAQFGGRSPRHFNPHSPCGERLLPCVALGIRTYFNPHSPCGERLLPCVADGIRTYFNPHSPCGERPPHFRRTRARCLYFNPHSPCGERLMLKQCNKFLSQFQSTLPLRGATAEMRHF